MTSVLGASLSRRQVIGAAGAAVIARFVRVPFSTAQTGRPLLQGRPDSPAADLSVARFTPHVGSDFVVRLGGLQTVRLTLLEVENRDPYPADRRGVSGESFSLVFSGRDAKRFEHGTHTIVHESLGVFPLFLVAVGPGGRGQRYQAVVDRRSPAR